jgi:hypothetical protein
LQSNPFVRPVSQEEVDGLITAERPHIG